MDVGEGTVKVYIATPREDWVLRKVLWHLASYAPGSVEIVDKEADADLVVLHVIGRRDATHRRTRRLLDRGQRYAMIQYSLRSTMRPHTSSWLPLWRGAVVTWSYYDLEARCAEDWTPFDFRFYYAPLGADSEIFWPRKKERQYVIGTSGHSAVTEGVREAAFATKRVGRSMLHLGLELNRGPDIVCKSGVGDDVLASLLSECDFVAGLRRTEGFELMAAEGLLCGARPICFDRDHYRQWYEPWAVFIPEASRDEVISSLEAVFREGAQPVTEEERLAASERFDWQSIIAGFWERVHGDTA